MKTIIDYTNVIKTYIDENSGTTIVQIPSVIVDNYTYNGTAQGPTVTGFDSTHCNITNATKTNAGTYTMTISLKDPTSMLWRDFTTADRTYEYTIAKADSDVTLSKNSVSLDANTLTDTVTISDATGTVTVSSSDANVATATLSNDVITITGVASGNATVNVVVAGDDNYNSITKTISVEVTLGPALVSWSTGTDEEIADMINGYYNGEITLEEIQSVWSVGDSRTITLSAIDATGVDESHRAQDVDIVILDFDHDFLYTPIGDKNRALVSVQLKNCLMDAECAAGTRYGSSNTENGYMHNSDNNAGGWFNCARKTWCDYRFYNALPSSQKNLVKIVVKYTSTGSNTTASASNSYCWLPSEIEVFGVAKYSVSGEGSQYPYFTASGNNYKLPKWESYYHSAAWALRSCSSTNSSYWLVSGAAGSSANGTPNGHWGLAPAWCL